VPTTSEKATSSVVLYLVIPLKVTDQEEPEGRPDSVKVAE